MNFWIDGEEDIVALLCFALATTRCGGVVAAGPNSHASTYLCDLTGIHTNVPAAIAPSLVDAIISDAFGRSAARTTVQAGSSSSMDLGQHKAC